MRNFLWTALTTSVLFVALYGIAITFGWWWTVPACSAVAVSLWRHSVKRFERLGRAYSRVASEYLMAIAGVTTFELVVYNAAIRSGWSPTVGWIAIIVIGLAGLLLLDMMAQEPS